MLAPLDGLPLIGAMCPMLGKAPLAIADPVYRLPDGRVLIGRRNPDHETVEGEIPDDGDWQELIETQEACELPEPVVPGVPVSVWVLRFFGPAGWRCVALGDLRQHDAEVRRWWVGDACVCIVRQDRGDEVRSVLAAQCDTGSTGMMALRDWAAALPWADIGMLAEPGHTPERWGRLIGLTRAVHGDDEADSYLACARNSWGDAFAEAARRVADEMTL